MKKIFYILTTALAVAALNACDNGEGDVLSFGNKDLAVVEANLLFGPEGGSNTVTVESTSPISATSSSSWASVSVNGKSITVSAPAYSSNVSRYAKITIKAGDESTSVTAQQMGVTVVDFHPADINAASSETVVDYTFKSNVAMTATADVDWIIPEVIKPSDPEEPDTLRIKLLENPTVDVRTGVVSYAAGAYDGSINVTQSGAMVQNPNWTITYEGVTKVDGHSQDDFQVAVGSEDTGKYAFTVLPASQYTASGKDMKDFVATDVAPLVASATLYSDTQHFYYPKFENDKYIAFAVGINDKGLTSGYYQYYEFTINRDKTPYEKFLGTWTVARGDGNTDEWVVTEIEEDVSVKITGICGASVSWLGNFLSNSDVGVVAKFNPETGKFSIQNGQIIGSWDVGGNYGIGNYTLLGQAIIDDTLYRISGTYDIGTIEVESAVHATMYGGIVNVQGTRPVISMLYYVILSNNSGLVYNANTSQAFPANLNKAETSSVSPKPRSVRVPYRQEMIPATTTAVSAR